MASASDTRSSVSDHDDQNTRKLQSGALPGWVDEVLRQLVERSQQSQSQQHQSFRHSAAEIQQLLDRRRSLQERAERVHRFREELLNKELNLLRESLESAREKLAELQQQQSESSTDKQALQRRLVILERELAALRLEHAANEREDAPVKQVRFPKQRQAAARIPFGAGTDDTSVATPKLQPVDFTNADQLAFELSATKNERDNLKRELRSMEEILQGSGRLPEELSSSARQEWRLRALASEQSCNALSVLLREQLAKPLANVKRDSKQEASLLAKLGAALDKPTHKVVKLFEKEQQRYFEIEKRSAKQLESLTRDMADLRDELEEAFRQVENLRAKNAELEGERREEAQLKLESELAVSEQAEQLERLREQSQDVERENDQLKHDIQQLQEAFANAILDRQALIQVLADPQTPVPILNDSQYQQDFRSDLALLQGAVEFQQQHYEHWRDQLVAPVLKSLDDTSSDPDTDSVRAVLLALKADLASQKAQFGTLTQKLEENNQRLRAVSQTLPDIENDLSRSRAELKVSHAQLGDLQSELRNAQQDRLNHIQKVQDAVAEWSNFQSSVDQAKQLFEAHKKTFDDLQKDLSGRARDQKELSERLEQQLLELAKLGDRLAEVRSQDEPDSDSLEELEQQQHGTTLLIDQLRKALADAQENKSETNRSVKEEEEKYETAERAYDEVVAKQRALEGKRVQAELAASQTDSRIAQLKAGLEGHKHKLVEAETVVAERQKLKFLAVEQQRKLQRVAHWTRHSLGVIRSTVSSIEIAVSKIDSRLSDSELKPLVKTLHTDTAEFLSDLEDVDVVPLPSLTLLQRDVEPLLQQLDDWLEKRQKTLLALRQQLQSSTTVDASAGDSSELVEVSELFDVLAARQVIGHCLKNREETGDSETESVMSRLRSDASALIFASSVLFEEEEDDTQVQALLDRLQNALSEESSDTNGDDAYEALSDLREIVRRGEQQRSILLATIAANTEVTAASLADSSVELKLDQELEHKLLVDGAVTALHNYSHSATAIHDLQIKVGELREKITGSEERVSELESELDSLSNERDQLQRQLRESEQQREKSDAEDEEQQQKQFEELEQRLLKSEQERQSLTRRISQIQAEAAMKLKQLESEKSKAERAKRDAERFVKKHEKQIEEMKVTEASEGGESNPEFAKLLKRKEREIRKLKIFLDSERKRIEQLTEERSRLKEHLNTVKKTGRLPRPQAPANTSSKKPGRVDLTTLRLPRNKFDKHPVNKSLVKEFKERIKRTEQQLENMSRVARMERKRRTEVLERLKLFETNSVTAEDGRVAELQLQVQRMETKLRRESTAREEAERSSRSKLEQLAQQLQAAQKKLDERKSRVSKLENELAARERQALTSDAKALRLSRELEEARSAIADHERALKLANRELEEKKQQVDELASDLDSARAKTVISPKDNELLQNIEQSVALAKAEAEEAKQQLDSMREQLEDQTRQRDELRTSFEVAEAQVRELSEKLRESGETNLAQLREHQELREQLDQAHQELVTKETSLDQARKSLEAKNEAVESLEQKLSQTKSELDTNREAAEQSVADIESRLSAARDEVERRTNQVQALSNQVASDQRIREDLERTADFAQQLVKRVGELQQQLLNSQQNLAAHSELVTQRKQQLSKHKQRHDELVDQAEQTETELDSIKKDIESEKKKIQALTNSDDQVYSKELAYLEEQRARQQTRLEEIRSELADLRAETAQSAASVQQANIELRDIRTDETDITRELEETQHALNEISAQHEDLTANFIEPDHPIRLQIEQLRQALDEEKHLHEEAAEEARQIAVEYQEELEVVRQQLSKSQEILKKREQELASTKDRLEESEALAHDLQTEVEQTRAALETAEAHFKELSERHDQSATNVEEKARELQSAESHLNDLRSLVDHKDQALGRAREEVEVQREFARHLEIELDEARQKAARDEEKTKHEQATSKAWLEELSQTVDSTMAELDTVQHKLKERDRRVAELEMVLAALTSEKQEVDEEKQQSEHQLRSTEQRVRELEAEITNLQTYQQIPSAAPSTEQQQLIDDLQAEAYSLRKELRLAQSKLEKSETSVKAANVSRVPVGASVGINDAVDFQNEVLHWILFENEGQRQNSGSQEPTELIVQNLSSQLSTLKAEHDNQPGPQDTQSIYLAMRRESMMTEVEDFLAWFGVSADSTAASKSESGPIIEQSPAVIEVNMEEPPTPIKKPGRDKLTRKFERLQRAREWALREQMDITEIEQKLAQVQGDLKAIATPAAIPGERNKESQLELEIERLKAERQAFEREALAAFEALQTEKQELAQKLEDTETRLENVDQVLISLHSGESDAHLRALVTETESLKATLLSKNEEIQNLESDLKRSKDTDAEEIAELKMVVSRLRDLLETKQEEIDELRNA